MSEPDVNMNTEYLLVSVVQLTDTDAALKALAEAGVPVTLVSSMGGFLNEGNSTLLSGVPAERAQDAIDQLAQTCRRRTVRLNVRGGRFSYHLVSEMMPVEVDVGGASAFLLPLDASLRLGATRTQTGPVESPSAGGGMKLILAVVPRSRSDQMMRALNEAQYRVTCISTTGGFLRKGNTTLLIGVESQRVADVLSRIERVCQAGAPASEREEAYATIFVLDVAHYERV